MTPVKFIYSKAPLYKSISQIFGILNKECSNFTKLLVLVQTSTTIKRYKRYLKTSLFRETWILPLNNDRFFLIKLNKFYDFKVYCEQVSTKWAGWKFLHSWLLNFGFKILCNCLSCCKNTNVMPRWHKLFVSSTPPKTLLKIGKDKNSQYNLQANEEQHVYSA